MKLGLLLSDGYIAQFGATIEARARAGGVDVQFIPMSLDPAVRVSNEDLARVDATFLTRDMRSPEQLDAFGHTVAMVPKLRWIHFSSSGMNPYPWVGPTLARGVRMSTSTGANAEPVAQIALLGLLMTGRKVAAWIDNQHKRKWQPHSPGNVPPDLAGQTAVIVGLGTIGRRVAEFARMLRLEVIGVRRSARTAADTVDELVTPAQLADVLPRADFLILNAPLTEETRNLIDARALALLKPTASLINVARGEIVDEPALIAALREGRLAGAYLNVFAQEPLPIDSPLWSMPNVIMSPHNAASARGNDTRCTEYLIENIGRLARGEALVNEYKGG